MAKVPESEFVQLDSWEGGELWSTTTVERMRGSDVRVLVPPHVTREVALALLRSLADWLGERLPPGMPVGAITRDDLNTVH